MNTTTEQNKPQAARRKGAGDQGGSANEASTLLKELGICATLGSLGTAQKKAFEVLAVTRMLRQAVALTPADYEHVPLNAEGLELVLGQAEQGLQELLSALADSVTGARQLTVMAAEGAH